MRSYFSFSETTLTKTLHSQGDYRVQTGSTVKRGGAGGQVKTCGELLLCVTSLYKTVRTACSARARRVVSFPDVST